MNNCNGDIDINEVFGNEFDNTLLLENFENSVFHSGTSDKSLNRINLDNSCNKNNLNVSALCCDEEISGYDKLTGKTWIYPTNYPVRDYQFNIIKASILKNTLVSLPTGLGKTFIAAVIMYNFYRWYPLGKIVFTAPTRPLVAQQIEACYNIIAIPPKDTIEMTGHMQVNTRKLHWETKRVFFATPQVIYNDIKSGICPGEKIRCLVIDEAHRARGNYAYCQIVSTLTEMGHKTYRILALSATPGSKVEDVITVVKNLHIAHLELRTENCIDVAPYSHSRKISTVVVQLGSELTQLRQQYVDVLDGYARRLKQFNILPQNLGNLSKGRIVMLYKDYQSKEKSVRHSQHNYIMKDFTILIALYHGLELLVKHGSRVFLNFFDEHPEKSWIQSDDQLTALLERLRDDLGINPLSLDRSLLPDGTVPEMPINLSFGHPKFYKLKEIMVEHFEKAKKAGQDTRAIVFCEYRESVNLVHCLLLQCRPLINPQMFVGQGASGKEGRATVSQKQQLRVMRCFRAGTCNALVATCVAEEGLDVGSVDLILCFDISTRSPIRLVQRCGRTGRERGGQVFILVTEGREHQTLLDCMRQRDSLNRRILQSKDVENNLYKLNPRMVPHDFIPECQKMYISVAPLSNTDRSTDNTNRKNKGQKDLRTMFLRKESTNNSASKSGGHFITKDEFSDLFPDGYSCPESSCKPLEYFCLNKDKIHTIAKQRESDKLTPWLEWQRSLQRTVKIEHSRDTEVLVELLQYCDVKRFEPTPSSRNPAILNQDLRTAMKFLSSPVKSNVKKKKLKVVTKSPNKKDGDIRALFSATTKSIKSYTKLINDLEIKDGERLPTRLMDLLVDLSLNNEYVTRECYICQNVCDCTTIQKIKKCNFKLTTVSSMSLSELKLLDISLLDDVTSEMILNCRKSESEHDVSENDINCNGRSKFCLEDKNDTNNEIGNSNDENMQTNIKVNAQDAKVFKENFDIGDIDDIFAESSPEIKEEVKRFEDRDKEQNSSNPKETLEFFGLESIEDIFADYEENSKDKICGQDKNTNRSVCNENNDLPIIQPLSPSILSGRQKLRQPKSPVLCSQVNKYRLSTSKAQSENYSAVDEESPKAIDGILTPSYISNNCNKSMFTVTQLVEMINKSKNISVQSELNHGQDYENERSSSPIIMTQAEKRKFLSISEGTSKIYETEPKKVESLIILDSDSDSNDKTQEHNVEHAFRDVNSNEEEKKLHFSQINNKRKLSIEDNEGFTLSPYFNKKQKLNDNVDKPSTLPEKVLAVLTRNEINNIKTNSSNNVYCAFSLPSPFTQKENQNPRIPILKINSTDDDDKVKQNGAVEMLQKFRRDFNCDKSKGFDDKIKLKSNAKIQITFDDDDDDFVDDINDSVHSNSISNSVTNHKARKRKQKNVFLDEEAELSDDVLDGSGDELTDESVGSIVDFICDDNLVHNETDMHAHYLRSVRSPVKGVFKIPQLPNVCKNDEVFSQFVEEDAYEMDSFCVDSHIGLTQVNDETELDLAEKLLEEKRNEKKKVQSEKIVDGVDSHDMTVIKRRRVKRQISSSSDDSS